MTIYLCDNDRRRQAILGQPGLNGIDYLEVLDQEAPSPSLRQQILVVSFINPPPPAGIGRGNVLIAGGERITGIQVTSVSTTGNTLTVQVNEPGDFSQYTLRIVDAKGAISKPVTGVPAVSGEWSAVSGRWFDPHGQPTAKSSTICWATSSWYCTGGDFMK